jgi:hypothetical protein
VDHQVQAQAFQKQKG